MISFLLSCYEVQLVRPCRAPTPAAQQEYDPQHANQSQGEAENGQRCCFMRVVLIGNVKVDGEGVDTEKLSNGKLAHYGSERQERGADDAGPDIWE